MKRLPKETRKQRRERERLQRQMGEPSQPSQRWLWYEQMSRGIYGAIGVVAALVGLLVLYPWLSLEQGERLRPTDPFGIMLNVSNEGFLPLRDIGIDCGLNISMSGGGSIKNIAPSFPHFADSLSFKHKLSLPCFRAAMIFSDIAEVHLRVIISYNIWQLPGRRNQEFFLTGVKDFNNDWHWLFEK